MHCEVAQWKKVIATTKPDDLRNHMVERDHRLFPVVLWPPSVCRSTHAGKHTQTNNKGINVIMTKILKCLFFKQNENTSPSTEESTVDDTLTLHFQNLDSGK